MPLILPIDVELKTATFTAVVNGRYAVRTDSAAITVNLPSAAAAGSGAVVQVSWVRGYNTLTFTSAGGLIYPNGSSFGDAAAALSQAIDNLWVGSTFTLISDGSSWLLGLQAIDVDAMYHEKANAVLVAGRFYRTAYLANNQVSRIAIAATEVSGARVHSFEIISNYRATGGAGYANHSIGMNANYGGRVFDYITIGSNNAYSVYLRCVTGGTYNVGGKIQTLRPAASQWRGTDFMAEVTSVGNDYGGANIP